MSLRKHLEHFAQNTSMHGCGRVILTKKPEKRAAWVIVFLAAWVLFAYQLTTVLTMYFKYSKKTTTEFSSGGAPFPAITLCNMQSLDFHAIHKFLNPTENPKSKSNNSIKESIGRNNSFAYNYKLLRDVVLKYTQRGKAAESQLPELIAMFSRTIFLANFPTHVTEKLAIKKKEFIVTCTYRNSSCNFTEIRDPYYLKCFTFEPPNTRNTSFENFQSLSEGISNGLSVTVFTGIKSNDKNIKDKMLPGVYEKDSPLSGSSGIRVVIHPPGTEPFPLTEGYDVPPGFQASFGITPERRIRLDKPYGRCAKKNIYKRYYFETHEHEPYRKISCERMCMQQQVIKECKCFDDTLPNMGNTRCYDDHSCVLVVKNDTRSNDVEYKEVQTCRSMASFQECALNVNCSSRMVADTLKDIRCADGVIERLMTDLESRSKCNCYAPCDEFRYQVSYSMAKWPSSGYESGSVYRDIYGEKTFRNRFTGDKKAMYMEYLNRSGMESLNDFAKVNVYIADSNVLQIIEEPATTKTQLISEIGGQLGIWIGVSVITISEILETIMKIASAGFRKLCRKFMGVKTESGIDPSTKPEKDEN